jgi:hypothetical protein
LLPRQRARDQQADRAGMRIKQDILSELAALDPDAADLEAALAGIVEKLGPPTGPARAVAVSIREEWQTAAASPRWVAYLLEEATRERGEGRRRGRLPS